MPPVMMLRLVEQGLNPRLRETPCSRIERFLLRPDDGFGVGILIQVLAELGPGEGIELLESCDGRVTVVRVGGAVFVEGGIDLT